MLKNNNINIRKEHEILQNDFGIDILYIRSTKYVRCKCFNSLHKIGDPTCPICMGSGHLTSITKNKVVMQSSISGELTKTEIGHVSSSELIFYLKYDMMPNVKDYIFLTGWDRNGLPQEIQKAYEIVSVQDIRGDNGRIELLTVKAKLRPEMLKSAQNTFNSLDKAAKKLIAKGKRYVWPIKETNMT